MAVSSRMNYDSSLEYTIMFLARLPFVTLWDKGLTCAVCPMHWLCTSMVWQGTQMNLVAVFDCQVLKSTPYTLELKLCVVVLRAEIE